MKTTQTVSNPNIDKQIEQLTARFERLHYEQGQILKELKRLRDSPNTGVSIRRATETSILESGKETEGKTLAKVHRRFQAEGRRQSQDNKS